MVLCNAVRMFHNKVNVEGDQKSCLGLIAKLVVSSHLVTTVRGDVAGGD